VESEKCVYSTKKPIFEELAPEILKAGSNLLAYQPVRLYHALKNSQHVPTGKCPDCGESYPLHHGPTCLACGGAAYYEYREFI
jgi:formylmethanofuran dehydrogenase subunit E